MTDVAIVGGSEETRLLLRGLVRLHHYRVVFEGAGPETLHELPPDHPGLVVLVDADAEDEAWSKSLQACFADRPDRRGILIAQNRSVRVEQRAKELGFAAVLRRPFAVHELVEIIAPPTVPPPSEADPSPHRAP